MSKDYTNLLSDTTFPIHRLNTMDNAPQFSFAVHSYYPGDRFQETSYPHRHTFYQVIFITAGRGFHVVDFESLPIDPPVIFFISPGQVHFWQLETPLRGYGLSFSQEFLEFNVVDMAGFDKLALFRSLTYTPLYPDLKQSASLQETIKLLVKEYKGREPNYISVVSAYFHILLSQIQRLHTTIEPETSINPSTELVHQFRQLVSTHYLKQRSISFYAHQLGVSSAHLSKIVKAFTGYTVGQIIRQELVLEAKRFLINTDWTIEQISYHLKFKDPAYFGRFFKRETANSPGNYRQEILEKYQSRQV